MRIGKAESSRNECIRKRFQNLKVKGSIVAPIYDSLFAKLDFEYSDEMAKSAILRAIEKSRNRCRDLSLFENASAIEGRVRKEALADLVDGDSKHATRRRAVHGLGNGVVPTEKWTLHIDRVLWSECRISPKGSFKHNFTPKE